MNVKKTLVLAVILGAALLYLTKISLPKREYEAKQNTALAGVQARSLQQIRVTRRESPSATPSTYELVNKVATAPSKDNGAPESRPIGEWKVAEREAVALDDAGLRDLMNGIQDLKVEGPIEKSEIEDDYSVYGLHSPVLTIVAEGGGASPASTEIAFGKKNEYLGKRYVKVSGREGIYLAEEGAFTVLNKSLKDIRAKTPVAFANADIKSFVAASSQGTVTVQRESDTAWKITDPYTRPASALAVSTLLDSLRSLRAVDFIDVGREEYKKYGLSTPRASIRLFFAADKGPSHLEVIVGRAITDEDARESTYFTFTGAPSVYRASTDDLAPFIVTADALRERKLLNLEVSEIQSIKGSGENVPSIEIAATATDWTVNGKKSDPLFVEQILNDIVGLQAAEFTDKSAEHAFDNPYLSLVITKKGEAKEQVVVTVGAEVVTRAGTRRFARVGTDGEPVLITDVDAKRIVPHEEALTESAKTTPQPDSAPASPTEVAPITQ